MVMTFVTFTWQLADVSRLSPKTKSQNPSRIPRCASPLPDTHSHDDDLCDLDLHDNQQMFATWAPEQKVKIHPESQGVHLHYQIVRYMMISTTLTYTTASRCLLHEPLKLMMPPHLSLQHSTLFISHSITASLQGTMYWCNSRALCWLTSKANGVIMLTGEINQNPNV